MEDIVLLGSGGHAKSVADTIERIGKYRIAGYTDFEDTESKYQYLGTDEALQEIFDSGVSNAAICIGYLGKGTIREKLFEQLKKIGFILPAIIDPSAIVSGSAMIEEGTFVGKLAVVNADCKVGKCCIVNTGAIIDHECDISDFVHVAVGTVICGQVKVGRGAFIGANSTVIQCRTIDEYTIVPAGETVRKKS